MDYNSKDRDHLTHFGSDIFNQFQEILQNMSLVDLCILTDIMGIILIFFSIMSIIFAYCYAGKFLINKFSLD